MSDRVKVEVKDGVADVRMCRVDKLNALDMPMFEALGNAGEELKAAPEVRAVVLSGEGRAFCAGLDFSSFQAMGRRGDADSGSRGAAASSNRPTANLLDRNPGSAANYAQAAGWVWHELPMPVIAAVHGVAYGGGLQIALGADLRLVTPDARLSVREIHWGLIPDMSGTQTLRHLVRQDVAKELTYTGRIVSGTEAVELGLATRVSDDPLADAHALAREIAGRSPTAVRSAKQLLNEAYLGEEADGLSREEKAQTALIGSPNQIEAVRANMEKREPNFDD